MAGFQKKWTDISDFLDWWLKEPRLETELQHVLERYYSSYKRRFGPYLRNHYARQTKEAQSLINKKNTRVLEVGCGCGTEALWFAIKGASVLGVDINNTRLEVARARARYLKKMLGMSVDAEFANKSLFMFDNVDEFDLIWMEQTFHHIEPRHKVPKKLAEITRPGGHVVISETNGWHPVIQLRLLRKRGLKTIREYVDEQGVSHMYGVERITTGKRIINQFSEHGFYPVDLSYFRIFPNVALSEKLSWIERVVPNWFLPAFTHYNVVLQKI